MTKTHWLVEWADADVLERSDEETGDYVDPAEAHRSSYARDEAAARAMAIRVSKEHGYATVLSGQVSDPGLPDHPSMADFEPVADYQDGERV